MNFNDNIDLVIVEDNPCDVELLLRALKKINLDKNFFVASNGEEALDFLFALKQFENRRTDIQPKLIILDINMPKVDGLEVLSALRSNERTRNIPVVIFTSSVIESDITKSYRAGANSYIVKPMDFDQFESIVKEIGIYWLTRNLISRI